MKYYICIICGETFTKGKDSKIVHHNRRAREVTKETFKQHKLNKQAAK